MPTLGLTWQHTTPVLVLLDRALRRSSVPLGQGQCSCAVCPPARLPLPVPQSYPKNTWLCRLRARCYRHGRQAAQTAHGRLHCAGELRAGRLFTARAARQSLVTHACLRSYTIAERGDARCERHAPTSMHGAGATEQRGRLRGMPESRCLQAGGLLEAPGGMRPATTSIRAN